MEEKTTAKKKMTACERREAENGRPVVGNWHDHILVLAQDVLDNGFPPAYDDAEDFEARFWDDEMPWNERAVVVLERIEADSRLPAIRREWLKRFGRDFCWDETWRDNFADCDPNVPEGWGGIGR